MSNFKSNFLGVLVLFVFLFTFGSVQLEAAGNTVTLHIRAFIDGRSQLVLQDTAVFWHHLNYAAPGRLETHNDPTYLNVVSWLPLWPDFPTPENRDCNCNSSTFTGVTALAALPQTVTLNIIQARSGVSILLQPDQGNNFTLIVDFDDNGPGGGAWYEITLTYLTTPTTLAGLAVERLDRYTGFRDEPTFVAEGATIGDRYRIHLATQPTADVTVQVRTTNPAELTLRGAGFAAVNSVTVTFRWNDNNPTNSVLGWSDWFSLSVSGVADTLVEGAEIHNLEYVLTSADPNYNGLVVAPEPVTVYDAGVVVTPLLTEVTEGTTVDYYTVVLSGPPGLTLPSNTPETVTVSLGGYDTSLINVTPTALTFNRTNWNIPQVVIVQAPDDGINDGTPATTMITHTVLSDVATLDSRYGGAGPNVSVSPVTVTIRDSVLGFDDTSDGLPVVPTVEPSVTTTPDAPGNDPPVYIPTPQPREGGGVPDAPADLPSAPTG